MTNVVISFHQKILFFTLHHYSLLFWHSPLFRQFFWPLGSHSVSWFYQPLIVKPIGELNTLVKEVILAPDFDPEHLIGFDAAKENKCMDEYKDNKPSDTPSVWENPRTFSTQTKCPFIIALLLWSDSTSLVQFGDAQLWPIYSYFGNQ